MNCGGSVGLSTDRRKERSMRRWRVGLVGLVLVCGACAATKPATVSNGPGTTQGSPRTELPPATAEPTTSTSAAPTTEPSTTTTTTAAPPPTTAPPAPVTTAAPATTAAPITAAAPVTTAAPKAPLNCPNGTYVNSDGVTVCSPYQSPSGPPAGATAKCNDGTYSFSKHRQGTCSGHGGVASWI